jgi:hypothetical protein
MWFTHDVALIVSALSDNTWTRLSLNSGQDAEAQSAGLHNPLTLIIWIRVCEASKGLGVFSSDQWLRHITAMSRECLSGDFQQFSTECAPLCDEELKVVLNCMGATWNICCRDHTNIAHILAGIYFWTHVDREFCLFEWVLTAVKPVTLFNTCIHKRETHTHIYMCVCLCVNRTGIFVLLASCKEFAGTPIWTPLEGSITRAA